MRNQAIRMAAAAVMCAAALAAAAPRTAMGADKKPVKPTYVTVTRLETQVRGRDLNGEFNTEAYLTNMLLYSKRLSKKNSVSMYVSNRICLTDGQVASNDLGISRSTMVNKRTTVNMGYSYSRGNGRGPRTPRSDSDRFNAGVRYIFNHGQRKNVETAFNASFTTATDLNSGQSVVAGVTTVFHVVPKKYDFNMGQRFSYGLQNGEFSHGETQTFQYDFSLAYTKGKSKYTLGLLFIDNTFTNNVGNNVIYSLTRVRRL